MNKYLLLLPLLIFTACLNSPDIEPYDDTQDIAYLEQYAQQEGVIMTESGLMYRIIEEGEGNKPEDDSYVFVNYEGESVDGNDRVSSGDNVDILFPKEFQTFRGFAEGVLLMNEGAIYEMVLPSDLALGNGRVYTFEVELESFLIDPDEFLDQNRENEDITVTESGLQYRVLEEGEGDSPGPTTTVRVNYSGSYTNGYVFDQSGENPANFNLSDTIPGFSEGIQLMNVGSKYELFIPSNIGYGNTNPNIIPGAVLVFEVELVEII
jgi:FKBP-type peptidyl-prolyl cis-trans isomerase